MAFSLSHGHRSTRLSQLGEVEAGLDHTEECCLALSLFLSLSLNLTQSLALSWLLRESTQLSAASLLAQPLANGGISILPLAERAERQTEVRSPLDRV